MAESIVVSPRDLPAPHRGLPLTESYVETFLKTASYALTDAELRPAGSTGDVHSLLSIKEDSIKIYFTKRLLVTTGDPEIALEVYDASSGFLLASCEISMKAEPFHEMMKSYMGAFLSIRGDYRINQSLQDGEEKFNRMFDRMEDGGWHGDKAEIQKTLWYGQKQIVDHMVSTIKENGITVGNEEMLEKALRETLKLYHMGRNIFTGPKGSLGVSELALS